MAKYLFLFACLLFSLTGCSKSTTDHHKHTQQSSELLTVKIQTPDIIKANEEVKIQAKVTQGVEKVNDADEVSFEIWKNGQENHSRVEGKSQGEGVYVAVTTFPDKGTYFIIAHVTARDMHSMPQKEIQVEP
jgi:YtkA-like